MEKDKYYGREAEFVKADLEKQGETVFLRIVTPDKQKTFDKNLVTGVKRQRDGTVLVTACGFLTAPQGGIQTAPEK